MRRYYILDTNVVSELMKSKPDTNVIDQAEKFEQFSAISSTTWSELLFGVQRMAEGKKKNLLLEDLVDDIQANYPIIQYDNHAAWIHADIRARLAAAGISIDFQDTQIASVAIANNMILVTRNTKHFEPIQKVSPLMMENWFERPAS